MSVRDLGEVVEGRTDALAQGGGLGAELDKERLRIHSRHLSVLLSNVNSFSRTHSVRALLLNYCMDNKTIRRINLDGLIAQFETIEALAKATNTVANYLSQIKGGSRKMGDATARKLERALDKEPGWIDVLHFASPDDAMSATEALQILDSLSEDDREAWMKHGRLLVEGNTARGANNPFGKLPRGGK